MECVKYKIHYFFSTLSPTLRQIWSHFFSLFSTMSDLIRWNDKCEILKKDSLPVNLNISCFPVVWYVYWNFSPGHRQWEHFKWQHLSISEQTHNEGYKEAQGAVQLTEFNGSLTLNWKGMCINSAGESCVGRAFDSLIFP